MSNYKHEVIDNLQRAGISYEDAVALRRISMTLHRWHELECGSSDDYKSWALVRGKRGLKATDFDYEENDGKPYLETHAHHGDGRAVYTGPLPDKERGAYKRLDAIIARYPGYRYFVQGDPRGCALYIMRPGDVPEGCDIDSHYTRGVAVYK